MLNNVKGLLPYILGLMLVSAFVFYPELQGKMLGASDALANVANSAEIQKYGQGITWNGRVFSGTPYMGHGGGKNYILDVYNTVLFNLPNNFAFLIVLLLCSFFSLRIMQVDKKLSFILSIALGLNTWILDSLWASHPTKIMSLAYIMLTVAGLIGYLLYEKKAGIIYIMIGLMFSIGNGHYQIIYYGLIICTILSLYFAVDYIRKKQSLEFGKKTLWLLLAVAIPVMIHLPKLYVDNRYNEETMRGGQTELVKPEANSTAAGGGLDINYAFSWSYTVPELLNFMVPDALGGSSSRMMETKKSKLARAVNPASKEQALPMHWGIQPFTGAPNYLGATVVFLFIFSMFYWKSKLKYPLLGLIILSVFMGLGRSFMSFNEILFNNLPLYNKFRAPTMAFAILNILSILVIGGGLHQAVSEGFDKERFGKSLWQALATSLGLLIVGYFMVASGSFTNDNDLRIFGGNNDVLRLAIEDRKSLLNSDMVRSIFLMALIFGSLFAFKSGKIKPWLLTTLLGVLIFFDLYTVYHRYLNYDVFKKVKHYNNLIPETTYDALLAQDTSYYRIFNSTNPSVFQDNNDSYRHYNIGGYSPAKLYRYQDMIDVHLSKGSMPVFNMLNAKYFIVDQNGQKVPQLNGAACGHSWFVNEVKFAANANDEIDALATFDPKTTAWVDTRYKDVTNFGGNSDSTAFVVLQSYNPDHMVYRSRSQSGGFAVFSEVWYKGNEDWKIFVDGAEVPMVRTNYILRGAYIPAGEHLVEMKMKIEGVGPYILAKNIASILFFLIPLGIFGLAYKNPEKKDA